MWECEECGTENDLDPAVEEGQYVDCMECTAEYEIASLDPLELNRMSTPAQQVLVDDGEDDPWD